MNGVNTPPIDERKAELESRFLLSMHSRIIKDAPWESGRNRLTQYSPILIDIWYPVRTSEEIVDRCYSLFIAQNDHTIPYYDSGLQLITWEELLRQLAKYAKPRKAEQMRLL